MPITLGCCSCYVFLNNFRTCHCERIDVNYYVYCAVISDSIYSVTVDGFETSLNVSLPFVLTVSFDTGYNTVLVVYDLNELEGVNEVVSILVYAENVGNFSLGEFLLSVVSEVISNNRNEGFEYVVRSFCSPWAGCSWNHTSSRRMLRT